MFIFMPWIKRLGLGILALAALLSARPAVAQTLSHAQVHVLIVRREVQVAALNADIQQDVAMLAQLQTIPSGSLVIRAFLDSLTTDIFRDQTVLETLRRQISLLTQLDAAQDQFLALQRDIDIDVLQVLRLQSLPIRTLRMQLRINNLLRDITNDQAALQALQRLINALERQIIVFL